MCTDTRNAVKKQLCECCVNASHPPTGALSAGSNFYVSRNFCLPNRNSLRHIKHLEPETYFMYHQFYPSEILCSAHNSCMCFTWISEQRAIISLYSINLSVFITEADGVYCAVRTGYLNQTDTVSSLKVYIGSRLCL